MQEGKNGGNEAIRHKLEKNSPEEVAHSKGEADSPISSIERLHTEHLATHIDDDNLNTNRQISKQRLDPPTLKIGELTNAIIYFLFRNKSKLSSRFMQ